MKPESPKLRDGAEWSDYLDQIVGNEKGLKNLIKACEEALENGKYYGDDLDSYVGVRKFDNDWFENPQYSTPSRIGNFLFPVLLISFVLFAIIGFITLVKWLL